MGTSEHNQEAQDAGKPLAADKKGAAREIGVSKRTVERLIANGELKTVRVGRRRLIPTAELIKFLKQRHHPTDKPEAEAVATAQ